MAVGLVLNRLKIVVNVVKKLIWRDEMKEKQFRTCEIVTQIDSNFDTDKFLLKVESMPYLNKYAFIVHDKDVHREDNMPVKTHYHLMLQLNNAYTAKRIASDLDVLPQNVQNCKTNFKRCIAYLTHETLNAQTENKHKYDRNEVHANFNVEPVINKIIKEDINNNAKKLLLNEIITGRRKFYEINDFFEENELDKMLRVLWDKDIKTACKVRTDILAKDMNREVQILYIYGKTGTGKTTYAKELAKQREYKTFICGASNDFMEGYEGEECIIIDDMRSTFFSSFSDSLKFFDNHTASRVKSRYSNKVIQAEMIIITASISISELFKNLAHNEDIKQIYRRVPHVIRVTSDKLYMKEYNDSKGEYETLKTLDNPIRKIIEPYKKPKKSVLDYVIS